MKMTDKNTFYDDMTARCCILCLKKFLRRNINLKLRCVLVCTILLSISESSTDMRYESLMVYTMNTFNNIRIVQVEFEYN